MNEIFMTTTYKVLKIMSENMFTGLNQTYCPLTQGDIAKVLEVSRPVVNKAFIELKNAGYIEMLNKSKWLLTDKAFDFLEKTLSL